ncbi:Uncharacterized protein FKW44_025187 [Caligus rogercresseyi]|uniref:Uncharacterized protein n=1 Tax=Caligus rogercresseyi TaxID=217165 RepID=A0A7T8GL15_CALRO|nr:Uncharacterized protein FKW44_025187 [Caligus rogercresseyi]
MLWAIALYNTMRRMGFVFQSGKHLFGLDIGEFLRVLYKDGVAKGYLMRCVGTLIIKPLQASEVSDPVTRVSALSSQLSVLCRRGLSKPIACVVWEAIIPYKSSFLLKNQLNQLPRELLISHPLRGGLGVPPPRYLPSLENKFDDLPRLKQSHFMLLGHSERLMSSDWITTLDFRNAKEFNLKALSESLHKTNLMSSLTEQDRLASALSHADALHAWTLKQRPSPIHRLEPIGLHPPKLSHYGNRVLIELHQLIRFPEYDHFRIEPPTRNSMKLFLVQTELPRQ